MNKHLLPNILLVLMVVILGCNTQKNATQNTSETCDTIRIETRYAQNLTEEMPTFITDSFTNMASEAFTIASIQKNHSKMLSLKKEPFRNIHDHSRIDTIYHFSGKKDTIKFYRSRRKVFMIYLNITSPELVLDSCIRPGITKQTFQSVFGITRPVGSTIQIANSDGTLRFIFYFQDDVLQRIESDFYFG